MWYVDAAANAQETTWRNHSVMGISAKTQR